MTTEQENEDQLTIADILNLEVKQKLFAAAAEAAAI